MTRMFRKQIYISRRQQVQLKRLATARGVSEAEVVRQAIEREVSLSTSQPAAGDHSALVEFLRFGASRRAVEDATGHTWTRDELYDDRLGHYKRQNS
jgi:hypothetical protein